MGNYVQSIDFSSKDALASGNPAKSVLGADIDTEFGLISTAIQSKLDTPTTEAAKAAIALPGAAGFYAVPSANQGSVVTATDTKVLFATATINYGSYYTAGTSTFTVPVGGTGLYMLTATVITLSNISDAGQVSAWFELNGAATLAGTKESNGVADMVSLNISWIGYLAASNTVIVNVRHDNAGNITLDATSTIGSMSFGGVRLS